MKKEFVNAWRENMNKLQEYFKTTKQEEYDSYEKIVTNIFQIVINPYLENNSEYPLKEGFNTKEMTVIDNGDYQGTQLFILPLNVYQPSIEDYVVTNTYYGSCSGCDTLLSISSYDTSELPNEEQVKGYMTLSLHIIQKCKMLYEEENK